MSARQFITVHDHPVYVPNPIPPAPLLQLKNGTPAPTLGELLFLPLNQLRRIPIEYKNLTCATMLPDTHDLDIPACIKTLREWTDHVRKETERYLHQFRRAPATYNNSEAFYRAMMLITVIQQDFGVSYDPGCRDTMEFKSSREGFIHGLLTGTRTGTCANMPMLYAAIGRALGYPLYVVAAKSHLFLRWASRDGRERFNVEGSSRGMNSHTDAHYRTWPRPITDGEIAHGIYLRNLDPVEELGCFMATRGHCLLDRGHLLDAILAYSHAHRLAPADPNNMGFLLAALNKELDMQRDGKLPSSYLQAENWDKLVPVSRFVLNSDYTQRIAGAHVDEVPGKIADRN